MGIKDSMKWEKIHDLSEAGKIPSCEEWKYEGANNVIYLIITPTSSLRYVSLLSFSSASFSPVMAVWSCHLIGRCLLPWESLGWVTLNYSARGLKKRCPIFLTGVHVVGFLSSCLLLPLERWNPDAKRPSRPFASILWARGRKAIFCFSRTRQ